MERIPYNESHQLSGNKRNQTTHQPHGNNYYQASHQLPERRYARQNYSVASHAGRSRTVNPAARYSTNNMATQKKALIGAVVAVVLVAAIWCVLIPAFGKLTPDPSATSGNNSSALKSTPRNEWKQGTVPLLFQNDPEWSSMRYNEGATLGESGCGPTCVSMVYVALTGNTDYDPAAMFNYASQNGYMGIEGIEWSFFSQGVRDLGIIGEEIPLDESTIRQNLVAGRPIICSMGPGDFTTTGHIIVLVGIDQNGKLIVYDPNSSERSNKHWDFDTIIAQCRNLWAYSKV